MPDKPRKPTFLFKSILKSRRSGRIWVGAGLFLIVLAMIIPNFRFPLLTLASLIGATASGYVAPDKRTIFFLGAVSIIAAIAVWAGAGERADDGLQWLAASLVLIMTTAFVVYYIRELEDRAFEFGWKAELSSEAAELGVFRWDFNTDLVTANRKQRELYSLPLRGPIFGEELIGRIFGEDAARVRQEIAAAEESDAQFRSEFRVSDKAGGYRWLAARGKVITDPRSGLASLAGVNFDVSEAKEAERLVTKLIDGISALFAITRSNGEIVELNKYGQELAGLTSVEWRGKKFWEIGIWGDSAEARGRIRALVEDAADGGEVTGEAPFWTPEGEKGWALISAFPLTSEMRSRRHLCLSAIDITKRKAAEETNVLLVQELNHRIKNMFSVTNALISLSAQHATSVGEFSQLTRDRLSALHAAHNIGAVDLKRRRANLSEIVETTLKPWRTSPPRIFVDGDPYEIDAGAATAWALIVHELASNATKFGSLRDPSGELHISWTTDHGDFVFRWRESGASPTPSVEREGFGSTIVRRLVEGFLEGRISRKATESGMTIEIAAPQAPP